MVMYTSDRARDYIERAQKCTQFQFAKPYPEENTFSAALAARQPLRIAHTNGKMVGSSSENPQDRIDRGNNDSVQNILNDLAKGQQ